MLKKQARHLPLFGLTNTQQQNIIVASEMKLQQVHYLNSEFHIEELAIP